MLPPLEVAVDSGSSTLEAWVDRAFPGMGWRPVWLTVVSTWCLSLYISRSGRRDAPQAFLDGCVALFGPAPEALYRHFWSHAVAVLLLMIIPLAVCRMAGLGPTDLGLRIRGTSREWLIVVAMWLAFTPVVWWFSGTESFAATYPKLRAAENSMSLYLIYETTYLVKWMAWEFFFRGFMLFGFATVFGTRAVLFSTVPFAIAHFAKPEVELLAAVPSGFILCWISWQSKSIWPGVFLHSMVASTMDFFASTWWHGWTTSGAGG